MPQSCRHSARGCCGAATAWHSSGRSELLDKRLSAGAQSTHCHFASHDGGEAIFQNERRIEILHLQEPLRSLFQSFLGDEANNFAAGRFNAVARCFPFHELEDAGDGRLFKIGQVHGYLRQAAHQESRAFDETKAAGRLAHCLGDLLGDFDVGGVQKNVVSDEELARAHHGRASGGVHRGFAKIGQAIRIGGNLGADAFELAAADVLQILAFGASGGGFIEINRNLVALPNLLADMAGDGDAILESDAFNRNKWHHVRSAHAGMCPLVLGQINQLASAPDATNSCLSDCIAIAYQSDDAAIVIGIHLPVEQVDAINLHRFDDGINLGLIAAFGKVGDALHQRSGHGKRISAHGWELPVLGLFVLRQPIQR